MLHRLMFLACFCVFVISSVDAKQRKHQIQITGSDAFIVRTQQCLDLLFEKYRESYKFVNKHVGLIAQSTRSGMVAWRNPPMYQMSNNTASYSLTWCASSIAHDAYHSYLYRKFKPKQGGRTPEHYWADFKAEKLAINYQIRVSKKIGSPAHELKYLNGLDGKHADIDGDGIITLRDYAERDW